MSRVVGSSPSWAFAKGLARPHRRYADRLGEFGLMLDADVANVCENRPAERGGAYAPRGVNGA